MKKPKYLFISNAAAPHQVNFIGALQRYFEVEFVFYVRREAYRPVWWEIPLNDK